MGQSNSKSQAYQEIDPPSQLMPRSNPAINRRKGP
jgi:hypothetical protein